MPHPEPLVASEAYAYPLLIKQLWHAPLNNTPDQEIVYRDRVRYRYRDLRQRVGRLASALAEQGVGFGDSVAVMDWDSHRYLEAYYAVPMMGAVLMTVNIRLSPEQILYTLNHARPRVVLLNADFAPVYLEIRDQLQSVERVIWISDDDAPMPDYAHASYEALLASASAAFEFPDFDENTRATTFYTTGTTGLPKGVYYSHRQLVLLALAGMAALASPASQQRFHRGDVYMPLTPMFHVHAWAMPYVALQLGVKQVYPGRYVPEQILRLIQAERVTFSHCVPTVLQMLLAQLPQDSKALSGWKVVIGGSALPTGLAQAACGFGIDVFAGYGMSETGPIVTIAQLSPDVEQQDAATQLAHRCRAGMAIPLVDLRIVEPDMHDVPRDGSSSGEIVVRAPWLTQGYLGNAEASDELWAGGYLHTQDIGLFDGAYLRITDRIKDVIKTGGEWVSSVQIEDYISQLDAVNEVAVIGARDEKWGERPVTLVVLRDGHVLSEADVKAYIAAFAERGEISKYAIPDTIRFVDALAKTSVGKYNKKLMRERYAAG
ncbi:MAG: fatty acid--CoA ligase [Nevskiales bacterium]|nr:fatty acid--CoA ligase [Nevskiales bacterium]